MVPYSINILVWQAHQVGPWQRAEVGVDSLGASTSTAAELKLPLTSTTALFKSLSSVVSNWLLKRTDSHKLLGIGNPAPTRVRDIETEGQLLMPACAAGWKSAASTLAPAPSSNELPSILAWLASMYFVLAPAIIRLLITDTPLPPGSRTLGVPLFL